MRIFDTFPFDGELDLLEHRLRETYDLVDVFVLVEAAQTYSGKPKELTFARNRERFAWASEKLRAISLDSFGSVERTARERAAIQRDAVRLALRDAEPDDVVLLFDVDEIASRELLLMLRERGIDQPRRVLMTRHYQYADVVAPHSPCCPSDAIPLRYEHPGSWDALAPKWYSASGVVAPYSALASRTAFDLRFSEIDAEPLANGGRHFSSVDPSTQLERKLHRVFHTEWAGARETAPAHLARCRAHGVHHRGWWFAERPDGELPADVARLVAKLGAAPRFPALWRRKFVRFLVLLPPQREKVPRSGG